MAVVTRVFTPADIFQGPCDVFLGITAPPSAVPPVQYTNTLQLDGNGCPPVGATGAIATGVLGNSGGTGYTVGDTLAVIQSGGSNGIVRVLTAPGGVAATFLILKGGWGYAPGANLATVGGTGTGCTFTISTITAGFHLGLTEGPAATNITPKFDLIRADQFSPPIDAAFVSNTGEIDFNVKELVLANIQKYLAGLFSATYFNLTAGSTNPAADFLQVGNTPSSAAQTATLLLVATRRDAAQRYLYMLAYKCHLASSIPMGFNRAKETIVKTKWKMLADTSRVGSDMACQIVRTF